MNIYLASSWRNVWQPAVVQLLRSWNHEVYDFHNPAPGDEGFHWSDIDPKWREWDAKTYSLNLGHPIAEDGFAKDMSALKKADACILLQPCGTSSHLELGWACGAGKKTAIFFPLDIHPGAALGHSMNTITFCRPCFDAGAASMHNGCTMQNKLRRIEPELMSKMANTILLSEKELQRWTAETSEAARLRKDQAEHGACI